MEPTKDRIIRHGQYRRAAGFTLVELVVVIVLAAVLVAITATRWSATDATAPYQAQLLARNIRHAQTLAMSWGQALRIASPASGYTVRCVTVTATPPCVNNPVIDPATGLALGVNLSNGVSLNSVTLDLDTLGRPVSGAALLSVNTGFTLTAGSETWSVTVRPITGFVSVASP
jgi:prepilin-type N-terminal cleavage/methylation domain-containing protein